MFPVTLTIHNLAQLNAVMAALTTATEMLEMSPVGRSAVVGVVNVVNEMAALNAGVSKQMAAPGKPSAAKTAPSQPTAEVAPSTAAPSDAAPETKVVEATPPTAAATSAPVVAYADLQKAVLVLHKKDPTKAVPIAKSLGADTFKALPEAKWGEALRLVNEAIAALGV